MRSLRALIAAFLSFPFASCLDLRQFGLKFRGFAFSFHQLVAQAVEFGRGFLQPGISPLILQSFLADLFRTGDEPLLADEISKLPFLFER
jgi:hypothetical protein